MRQIKSRRWCRGEKSDKLQRRGDLSGMRRMRVSAAHKEPRFDLRGVQMTWTGYLGQGEKKDGIKIESGERDTNDEPWAQTGGHGCTGLWRPTCVLHVGIHASGRVVRRCAYG